MADDLRFYEFIPRLFPQAPQFADFFNKPEQAEATTTRPKRRRTNSSSGVVV